jgi:NADH-quinone oxidoreductase subunit M
MTGGVLQMINHGSEHRRALPPRRDDLERRHTREIAALSGLQKVAPVFAAVFTVVMLSSIAVPGLNGFVGEFLILIGRSSPPLVGGRGRHRRDLRRALPAVGLPAGLPRRAQRGEPRFAELHWKEGLVLAPLIGIIVFIGVYPKPMLDRIEPSVDRLIAHVQDKTDYQEPKVATATPAEANG